MNTQTKLTQKLFVLNELSKEIDINIFDRITINKDYDILITAKYDLDLYHYLKNRYGNPTQFCMRQSISIVFTTEVIQIILEVQIK